MLSLPILIGRRTVFGLLVRRGRGAGVRSTGVVGVVVDADPGANNDVMCDMGDEKLNEDRIQAGSTWRGSETAGGLRMDDDVIVPGGSTCGGAGGGAMPVR